ncbi:MAG: type I restriction endonuclease subunit R [Jatrophihabitans sp.]|nr:MAG: type I restriction endonuclease subunit R [Jatrophihabitans sp.]
MTQPGAQPGPPVRYEPIAISDESTVVAEFVPDPRRRTAYQSEAQLEAVFVAQLVEQAYEYLPVTGEAGLVANLRTQLEALNAITFTDAEWQRFFAESIAGASDGIVEKTARIQEDHVQVLHRDDGTVKNVYLLDKRVIHNNRLQVINQYEVDGTAAARANRYDVTILVNGLPLVHVELKRRGVDIREAFNQINRYQRDSFWSGSGLFEYVQLFVISNGTLTKYYSNTTRDRHVAQQAAGRRRSRRQSSNTFEFTSWWADATNRPIADLPGFTGTFFAKHTLLNILTRYCVFDVDRKLLVMRPYQIVATERILARIATSTTYKQAGTLAAGGYVWHTTGSGKTLTSFKAAQLASRMPGVDKVLFVVDRKDLDFQTVREYDRFERGGANSNASTRVLARQLADPGARIIVTTIQKLARFIGASRGSEVFGQHVVIIFDECHRSQFGDMHDAVTRSFRGYHLFGFTGTPIFAQNAPSGGKPLLRTTEQAFGERLHTYTIVDAITDRNVLPFRIDHVNTIRTSDGAADALVPGIETETALLAPERIANVVDYVLDHFAQKTKGTFNSLFATASIDAAKRYYNAFELAQRQREAVNPGYRRLQVATIFSYAPNEEQPDGLLADEQFETHDLDGPSREFLEDAVADYNDLFGTNHSTSGDGFDRYYVDVARRLRNRDLDLAVVVNMFLTGFDATGLNTLWVDKSLRQHGLIQAFSRTNRILDSVKTFGNIVTFRNLDDATAEALALFGNPQAGGIVLLRPYAEYHAEYATQVAELLQRFPLGEPIVGEANQKAFIALVGAILRLRNILTAFDDFADDRLLSEGQVQDYLGIYLDLAREFRRRAAADRESIADDVVFEIELIKQTEVDVDYILMLVRRYLDEHGTGRDREVRAAISRAVDASPTLRNKRDLIEAFVDSLTVRSDVDADWRAYVAARREQELEAIIAEGGLRPEQARAFVADALRDGAIPTAGTAITAVLPPASRFTPENAHAATKAAVLDRLAAFVERYHGLG